MTTFSVHVPTQVRSRGRRSVGSSTPSSLSVSPAASADPSPNRISLTAVATQTNKRETEITIRYDSNDILTAIECKEYRSDAINPGTPLS